MRDTEHEIYQLTKRIDALAAEVAALKAKPVVHFTRVGNHDLPDPEYATDGAAAYDLRADLSGLVSATTLPIGVSRAEGGIVLHAWHSLLIPCGFAFEIPTGWAGDIRGRSGWSTKMLYAISGLSDPDYRGVVKSLVWNASGGPITIEHGDRIAQLAVTRIEQVPLEKAETLSATTRGTRGFNSTGTR